MNPTSRFAELFLLIFGVVFTCIANANPAGVDSRGMGTATDVEDGGQVERRLFAIDGFGTLAESHSTEHLGDYVLDSSIPKGPGLSKNWSADNDSRIGIQMQSEFAPKASAVLQVITEYTEDNQYQAHVEWANVKYAFTPNADIRVGRVALPTFLYSDSRKVGYSYPWVHPPVELYRQLAITNSDGIEGTYRLSAEGTNNTLKALFGKNTLSRATTVQYSRDILGVFDTLVHGPATFMVGYQTRKSSTVNYPFDSAPWIRNDDLSIGASYDPGDWFITSEWIRRDSNTRTTAMYASVGRRIDKFTPYVTYSQSSAASPGFGNFASQANTQSDTLTQAAVSLGTRWDFTRKIDFKLQIDLVRLGSDSNGYLANVPEDVVLYGAHFHLITATIDFIFP